MDLISQGPLRAEKVVWRHGHGGFTCTVVCKATFELRPGLSQLAAAQEPVVPADVYTADRGSLVVASELVPFKMRPEAILTGHAYAPEGRPVASLVARVAIGEIDKGVQVVGDRHFALDGRLGEPARFARMPLVWERAAGGTDTSNPAGVAFGDGAKADFLGRVTAPNLLPAGVSLTSRADVVVPAGFGPIAPLWPSRAVRLHRHVASWDPDHWHERPLPDIDIAYFNAAPADQQRTLPFGEDTLYLENLHPRFAQLSTRLPQVGPVMTVDQGAGQVPLQLRCDTLSIDTDRGLAMLVWRAHLLLDHPDRPGRILVTTTLPAWAPVSVDTAMTLPPGRVFAATALPFGGNAGPPVSAPPAAAAPSSSGPSASPAPPKLSVDPAPPPSAARPSRRQGVGAVTLTGLELEMHKSLMGTPAALPFAPQGDGRGPPPSGLQQASTAIAVPQSPGGTPWDASTESTRVLPFTVRGPEAGEGQEPPTQRPQGPPPITGAYPRAPQFSLPATDYAPPPAPLARPASAEYAPPPQFNIPPADYAPPPAPLARPVMIEPAAPQFSLPVSDYSPPPVPLARPVTVEPAAAPHFSLPVSDYAPPPVPLARPIADEATGPAAFHVPLVQLGRSSSMEYTSPPLQAEAPPTVVAPPKAPAGEAAAPPALLGAIMQAQASPQAGDTERPPPPVSGLVEEVTLPEPDAEPAFDQYPPERCGAIAARVACDPPTAGDVLRAEELDAARWKRVHEHWLDRIREDAARSRRKPLSEYDAAYVSALEAKRGALALDDYARLAEAAERSAVPAALSERGLPETAWPHIHRVWIARMARDPGLGKLVRGAIDAVRAAE